MIEHLKRPLPLHQPHFTLLACAAPTNWTISLRMCSSSASRARFTVASAGGLSSGSRPLTLNALPMISRVCAATSVAEPVQGWRRGVAQKETR